MASKRLNDFKAAIEDKSSDPEVKPQPLILVIDDDANLRSALQLAFSRSYRVRVCAGAAEGIGCVRDDVSVVVLDVRMTGIDGFTAYSLIRKKDPDLPIIFHSAYQDLKDPYKIINEYRPFGYIVKGANLTDLLNMVSEAVSERARTGRYRGALKELAATQARMEALLKRTEGK